MLSAHELEDLLDAIRATVKPTVDALVNACTHHMPARKLGRFLRDQALVTKIVALLQQDAPNSAVLECCAVLRRVGAAVTGTAQIRDDKARMTTCQQGLVNGVGYGVAWCLPDAAIVREIVQFNGDNTLIEYFAGHGLFAKVLRGENLTVLAYDKASESENWQAETQFSEVVEASDGRRALADIKDEVWGFEPEHSTLMLILPPYEDEDEVNSEPEVALHVLQAFEGDKLILAGEPLDEEERGYYKVIRKGSRTGTKLFRQAFREGWTQPTPLLVPQPAGHSVLFWLSQRKPRPVARRP